MEFTDEKLVKIKYKQNTSQKYSRYFKRLYDETESNFRYSMSLKSGRVRRLDQKKTYHNKYYKMSKCSEWWQWDLYEINEFMKLKKINLCGYSECPICRKLQLAKARIELRPKFEKLVNDGFKLLHVIFTVPSVTDAELRDTILKMNRAYYKLYKWIAIDKKERFRGTMINVLGAYKALEVTSHYKYVLKDTLYHPHFHVIFVVQDDYAAVNLEKNIKGDWSIKRKQFDMYSELDFQLMKLWTMAFNDMRITDYNSFSDDYNVLLKEELYRCNADLVKDDKAVLELLKYTYKDSQIKNYKTFKSIINSLYSVKKKQGYGVLYGDFDFEGISLDGEKENEDLLKELLVVEETPVIVLTRLPNLLNKQYQKYKKISIHNIVEEMEKIDDKGC